MKLALAVILVLSSCVLLCGINTSPKFNDGLIHLQVARQYAESHSRPTYAKLTATAPDEVHRNIGSESPLWYILVGGFGSFLNSRYHISSQCVQVVVYSLVMLVIFSLYCKIASPRSSLLAMVVFGTMPLFVVGTILCYLDLLATLLATTSFFFLIKKRWFLFIVSTSLLWYAKRTGIILVPAFGIAFISVFMNGYFSCVKRWTICFSYCLLFVVFICPDIFYRLKHLSDDLGIYQAVSNPLVTPYSSPSKLPSPAIVQWLGGIILLFPGALVLAVMKKRMHLNSQKLKSPETLVAAGISIWYIAVWLLMPLARGNIRYLVIILPIIGFVLLKVLNGLGSRLNTIVLITCCCLQFMTVLGFVFRNRQIDKDTKEILSYLSHRISKDATVLWDEAELGRWHLRRKIYGRCEAEYANLISDPDPLKQVSLQGVDYLVVSKRFLYDSNSKVGYDMGMKSSTFNLIKSKGSIVIDNDQYCLIRISPQNNDLSTEYGPEVAH